MKFKLFILLIVILLFYILLVLYSFEPIAVELNRETINEYFLQ